MRPRPDTEVQQHDAIERLHHTFEVHRRDFFKLLGAGLLVGTASIHVSTQESGAGRRSRPEMPENLDSWLHIGENGQVTVFTGKVEVGQNVRTSLAQQVAEELRVPLASVQMVMGDTELTPYDMGTFGSRTTPQMGTQLRKAAASARATLVKMAAEKWQVPESDLLAQDGRVREAKSGRAISYAELTQGQRLTKTIFEQPPVTGPEHWKIAGQPMSKINGRDFVTGAHKYTSDISLDGMLHGRVVRPSAFHAKLASCDTAQAGKIPGVTAVRDGDFLGVVAPDKITLGQWVDQWIATGAPGRRQKRVGRRTLERYAELLRCHVVPTLGTRPLNRHGRKLRKLYGKPTRWPILLTHHWSPAPRQQSGRTANSPSGPGLSVRSLCAMN